MCLKIAPKKKKNITNVCCPLTLFFTAPSNSLDCKKRDKKQEQKNAQNGRNLKSIRNSTSK